MASWSVCSPPEQAVWVWALARDIVLCSWAWVKLRNSWCFVHSLRFPFTTFSLEIQYACTQFIVYVTLNCVHTDLHLQLTSCTEQIVQLMQERDILQDANNQMNEVSARKLKVSLNMSMHISYINFSNRVCKKVLQSGFVGVAQEYIVQKYLILWL